MSRAAFEKWQARYTRGTTAGAVDPYFGEIAEQLPGHGRALDIAGGSGRNALFLAERGLETTLVDIAPSALKLAQDSAAATGLTLATVAADLDDTPLPDGPFELIVCSWFLLDPTLWQQIQYRLADQGTMVYVQPTTINLQRHSHPGRRFLLEPGSLANTIAAAGLTIVSLQEGWDSAGHHTARLLARKQRHHREPR